MAQKLRQVDVLVGPGLPRADAIREVRIAAQTYYRGRMQYGGMGADHLKELKRLRKENERLRKPVLDLTQDRLIDKKARTSTRVWKVVIPHENKPQFG